MNIFFDQKIRIFRGLPRFLKIEHRSEKFVGKTDFPINRKFVHRPGFDRKIVCLWVPLGQRHLFILYINFCTSAKLPALRASTKAISQMISRPIAQRHPTMPYNQQKVYDSVI